MRSFDEVRMLLAGEEYEVREISGEAFLRVRSEARKLSESIGAADGDGDLVLAAAVVSESLFLNGEKVFADAREALHTLTAAEIAEAAAVNPAPVIKKEEDPAKEESVAVKNAPRQEAETDAQTARTFRAPEIFTPDLPGNNRTFPEKTGGDGVYRARDITVPQTDKQSAPVFGRTEETGGEGGLSGDMKYVSGCFERDCRRYDGGFERY